MSLTPGVASPTSTAGSLPLVPPSPLVSKAQLPKLELHKFKGSITQWPTFWDSSVHDNNDLSPVDKFNYLQSLLKGPASKVTQCLPLTEANYNTAVELLKSRFGNPQVIIAAHMDELVNLPDCSHFIEINV